MEKGLDEFFPDFFFSFLVFRMKTSIERFKWRLTGTIRNGANLTNFEEKEEKKKLRG